ncbi:MAG: ribbon-helix-helix protein, CopG family [Deltaproteobacteria bacterium]|nr:ribbon-helix-helix protein, CopG family [Deltaproteobacteria bacterium]
MARVAHVRLDDDTDELLDRLTRQTGRSASEIVREGLRLVANATPPPVTPEIIGLGAFDSGLDDLGSNKAHLSGFGR